MSDNPLTGLFSSRTLVSLLTVFLMHPERAYYQQELVRTVAGPLRPVQLALEKLTSADLVTKRREGKQVYYQAQTLHPAFRDLQAVFLKTFAVADVLRDALEPMQDRIDVAFVFGSMAAADHRADSDVDLFVVGTAGRRDVSVALSDAEARLGREVNLNIYGRGRFEAAVAGDDPFVADVLSKPKIWVVGDPHALGGVAG
jgi:predicted nucleotidyltransferase